MLVSVKEETMSFLFCLLQPSLNTLECGLFHERLKVVSNLVFCVKMFRVPETYWLIHTADNSELVIFLSLSLWPNKTWLLFRSHKEEEPWMRFQEMSMVPQAIWGNLWGNTPHYVCVRVFVSVCVSLCRPVIHSGYLDILLCYFPPSFFGTESLTGPGVEGSTEVTDGHHRF